MATTPWNDITHTARQTNATTQADSSRSSTLMSRWWHTNS